MLILVVEKSVMQYLCRILTSSESRLSQCSSEEPSYLLSYAESEKRKNNYYQYELCTVKRYYW